MAGITVAVTRARAQASGLAARLRGLGADAVEAPAIRIQAIDGPAPAVDTYDLICLTSPNGVRLLFERLRPRTATPVRWPGRAWRRSGRARPPPCEPTA